MSSTIRLRSKFQRVPRGALRVTWLPVTLLLAGCVFDKDDRCGAGQVFDEDLLLCACPKDTVFTPEGCIKCGNNEVASAAGCECSEGFARASAGEPCRRARGSESEPEPDAPEPEPDAPEPEPDAPEPEPDAPEPEPDAQEPEPDAPEPEPDAPEPDAPEPEPDAPEPEPDAPESEAGMPEPDSGSGPDGDGGTDEPGPGADCDPAASTCEAPYDHCEPTASGGYCTNTCGSAGDCDGDYACTEASVCQRPPTGLDTPCTTPEDCAGNDAAFCDMVVTMACQVDNCTVAPNDCYTGYDCCDLTAFGLNTLCVPEGMCFQ